MKIKKKWITWEELLGFVGASFTINYASIGGLIPGSIPFANATGFLAEDNDKLFWDETNARLGLNQTTPTARIDIVAEASFPAINISAAASGEMSTPDGEQFRWGHWNEVDTFTERLKFDAAGIFYVSYLTTGSVIFAGAGGEIKQDNADFRWDTANKRLGIGRVPLNVLDVDGAGTVIGGTSYGGVVARFSTTDDKHISVSIDANTGKDPVLSFAENGSGIWDIRNDASASDEFQIRYQVGEVNLTYFAITAAGDVQIPSGYLALMNNEELRFYDNGNYVGFKAPGLGADQIWILPATDGGASEFLQTDSFGNLTWAAAGDVTAGANITDHSIVRGDGGAKGIQDSGILIDDNDIMTFPDGGSINLQEDITFTGATTENLIKMPNNLAVALSIEEGGNAYINFDTTDNAERITILQDVHSDRWLNSDFNFFMGVDSAGAGNLAHAAGVTGWHNVGIGNKTLQAITTGYHNVAIGSQCLEKILAGHSNVGLGVYALYNTDSGYQNMAIGYQALYLNEDGYQNVAIGYGTLYFNVIGNYNVAIGTGALVKNLSSGNIGIGQSAGGENVNGWSNVCIGHVAGQLATIPYLNVYIGSGVAWNQFGHDNVAIGYRAMYNGGGSAGNENVAIGLHAGYNMTTAHNNVVIGWKAGEDITTGDGNVCIGYMAGETNLTADSNELWIANTNTATPLIYGEFPNTLLRIRTTGFEVIGTAKLGDGGTTNYENIAADGTITLLGTAKVTKKVYLSNAAFSKGGTAPVQVILGNLNGWEFDIGDDAVMTAIMPDDWDPTTNITMKVCWYIDEAYAVDKEIQWRIDWSALPHDFSETVDAPTHSGFIESGDIDIPAVAKRMGSSTVGTIVAASLSAGDMLGFKISRIAVTEDDPTAKPTIHHLIIQYTADRIGT